MKILVAEDDRATRIRILAFLRQWGHEGIAAGDGNEAWNLFRERRGDFTMVITDWLMPHMDGIELIRHIRGSEHNGEYVYTILLTSRSEKKDVVEGIEAGADDLVGKPFDKDELRVRIQAGQRILALEHALAEQNQKLEAVNRKVTAANERMRESLLSAARIQQAYLPERLPAPKSARFAWHFEPCEDLAGDTLNVIALDERQVGFYIADVSGHGVPAALLSVHLSRVLMRLHGPDAVLRKQIGDSTEYRVEAPSSVAAHLNRKFAYDPNVQQYFTFLYGILDPEKRTFRYTSAGHPGPIVISRDSARIHRATPPAIGIVPDSRFSEATIALEAGDRLYLYTDGAFEITDASGREFGEEQLAETMRTALADEPKAGLAQIMTTVRDWLGGNPFPDDVSLVAVHIR